MKKIIYILLFTVLGFLVQFIVYAGIYILAVNLLTGNFERYGLGLSWATWAIVRDVAMVIFAVTGILLGFFQGKKWYKKLYEK